MSHDVIVVGGGFAGLSAACALAERGKRVLVFEARPTLGGRATAFTDPATGERVDNGQHVLLGCYHETFRFLRRVGAERHVRLQSDLSVDMVDRDGWWSRLSCPHLPPPLHLLVGALKWSALSWRDRVALMRVGPALAGRLKAAPTNDVAAAPVGAAFRRPRNEAAHVGATFRRPGNEAAHVGAAFRRPEDITVREWLLAHGQTPRLIEVLWEPLAVAALNQPIDHAAAAPFIVVLRRMFTGTTTDAALALPIKPLDEMYAVPARAFIEQHAGEVRVASPARIICGSEPSSRLRVDVRGETFEATAVICAAPWHALSDVLANPRGRLRRIVDAACATAASPIVTVNLWFDRQITPHEFFGMPGRTMQWVFDKRMMFGEDASHLSLVSSGAEAVVARTNTELTNLALDEVRTAVPSASTAVVERAVVVRERRATFSVAPGQPPRPSTITDLPGLFLAGDWIDTGLPATIESAVLSGHMAADAVSAFANSDS